MAYQTSARNILWAAGAILSAGVALTSYRYVFEIGPIPSVIATNSFRTFWLTAHAGAAATALLTGPVQFLPGLRARFRPLHRWLGRSYVIACLIGGATGLVLASGASTGPISTAGFGTLAVIWIVTTVLAWRAAMQRDFTQHRAWMIRSFALTLAAVTLRLYVPIGTLLPIPFDDAYRAISFLCWVPNLVLAELYLRGGIRSRRSAAPSPSAGPRLAA